MVVGCVGVVKVRDARVIRERDDCAGDVDE